MNATNNPNVEKKVYVTRIFEFSAAHNLVGYMGPCANVHGHNYKLEVTISAPRYFGEHPSAPESHMVIDFKMIKYLVENTILNKYDHCNLNDYFPMPTAESMVVSMYNEIYRAVSHLDDALTLEEVKLWETSDSYASYKGEIRE